MRLGVLGVCLLLQATLPQAQATQAPSTPVVGDATGPASPASQSPGGAARLPAGALFEVELVSPLSSAHNHTGDIFAIRLTNPIVSNGIMVVAAGAMGEGEVIDAAPAGMAGKAGKLILAARRLDLNGQAVRIRGLTLMAPGHSRVGLASAALFVPYVGIGAVLIKGGNVEIPAGARYMVKLAEDVDIPGKSADQNASGVR